MKHRPPPKIRLTPMRSITYTLARYSIACSTYIEHQCKNGDAHLNCSQQPEIAITNTQYQQHYINIPTYVYLSEDINRDLYQRLCKLK